MYSACTPLPALDTLRVLPVGTPKLSPTQRTLAGQPEAIANELKLSRDEVASIRGAYQDQLNVLKSPEAP